MAKKIKEILNNNAMIIFTLLDFLGIIKITRKLFLNLYLKKTKSLKITDTETLSHPIPLFYFLLGTPELHKSNDWYGHASILKNYSALPYNYQLKVVIEHGLFVDDYIWNQDMNNLFPIILTFGTQRALHIQNKTNKQIIPIGPYIYYAKPLLSRQQTEKEIKRLKKCLLVIPSHSTTVTDTSYDINAFCNKLISMKRDFDSIRICLYWKDINNGVHQIYKQFGFECVTAGHIFDPLFLPRLKSIIETSTITMSNSIGTHIGYCIFMKKPHYIFSQRVNYQGKNKDEIKLITDIEQSEIYKQIEKTFSTYSEVISEDQYKIVNRYWGLNEIKTKQQLKSIIDIAEKLYQKKTKLFS